MFLKFKCFVYYTYYIRIMGLSQNIIIMAHVRKNYVFWSLHYTMYNMILYKTFEVSFYCPEVLWCDCGECRKGHTSSAVMLFIAQCRTSILCSFCWSFKIILCSRNLFRRKWLYTDFVNLLNVSYSTFKCFAFSTFYFHTKLN